MQHQTPAPEVLSATPIAAEVHSDDYAMQVHFDASPFFENASEPVLQALSDCGFRGSEAADKVALWVALSLDDQAREVQRLFTYLDTQQGKPDAPGFEVVVDPDQAEAWFAANRPHLAAE